VIVFDIEKEDIIKRYYTKNIVPLFSLKFG